MRISDWSSDVCSSDLEPRAIPFPPFALSLSKGCSFSPSSEGRTVLRQAQHERRFGKPHRCRTVTGLLGRSAWISGEYIASTCVGGSWKWPAPFNRTRSEEHTSELQSLMRISYAVFCLKKKKTHKSVKHKTN